jgi:hypothetical protein
MIAPVACPKCGRIIHSAVRLWDGRDYCRDCVDHACPGLGDFAAQHPILSQRSQLPFWKTAGKVMLMLHALGAAWIAPVLAYHWLFPLPGAAPPRRGDLDGIDLLLGFLACGGFASVICALFSFAIALGGWKGRSLSIHEGNGAINDRDEFELRECRWLIQVPGAMRWMDRVFRCW